MALSAFSAPAVAETFHVTCLARDYCINRPGLIEDGWPVSGDTSHPPGTSVGGTVDVGQGVHASRVFILSAGGGIVIFRTLNRPYIAMVAPAASAFVECPGRKVWLGGQGEHFACP